MEEERDLERRERVEPTRIAYQALDPAVQALARGVRNPVLEVVQDLPAVFAQLTTPLSNAPTTNKGRFYVVSHFLSARGAPHSKKIIIFYILVAHY